MPSIDVDRFYLLDESELWMYSTVVALHRVGMYTYIDFWLSKIMYVCYVVLFYVMLFDNTQHINQLFTQEYFHTIYLKHYESLFSLN